MTTKRHKVDKKRRCHRLVIVWSICSLIALHLLKIAFLIVRNGRELVLIVSRYRNIDNKGLLILAIISNRGTPTRAMSSLWIQQETRRIIVNMWRDFTVLGRVWQKEMTTGRDDKGKNGNQQTNSQTHQKINQFYWVTHPKGQQGQNLIATSWQNYMWDDISKDNKATKWQNKIT